MELIGFSLTLFGEPALPLAFFGTILLPLGAVPTDFAADGAFLAVKLFSGLGNGAVMGQVLDAVSFVLGQLCVAHSNLSCLGKAVCCHIPAFFCYGKLHFKSESVAV